MSVFKFPIFSGFLWPWEPWW